MPEPTPAPRSANPERVALKLLDRVKDLEMELAMTAAYVDQVEEESASRLAERDAAIADLQDQLVALTAPAPAPPGRPVTGRSPDGDEGATVGDRPT